MFTIEKTNTEFEEGIMGKAKNGLNFLRNKIQESSVKIKEVGLQGLDKAMSFLNDSYDKTGEVFGGVLNKLKGKEEWGQEKAIKANVFNNKEFLTKEEVSKEESTLEEKILAEKIVPKSKDDLEHMVARALEKYFTYEQGIILGNGNQLVDKSAEKAKLAIERTAQIKVAKFLGTIKQQLVSRGIAEDTINKFIDWRFNSQNLDNNQDGQAGLLEQNSGAKERPIFKMVFKKNKIVLESDNFINNFKEFEQISRGLAINPEKMEEIPDHNLSIMDQLANRLEIKTQGRVDMNDYYEVAEMSAEEAFNSIRRIISYNNIDKKLDKIKVIVGKLSQAGELFREDESLGEYLERATLGKKIFKLKQDIADKTINLLEQNNDFKSNSLENILQKSAEDVFALLKENKNSFSPSLRARIAKLYKLGVHPRKEESLTNYFARVAIANKKETGKAEGQIELGEIISFLEFAVPRLHKIILVDKTVGDKKKKSRGSRRGSREVEYYTRERPS